MLRVDLAESVVDESALAKEVFIAIRKDRHTGSGTEIDPYDGSAATVFDSVMSGLTGGETIRLGPGTFPTQGEKVWNPRSGQRIIGSGIYSTTLKLALSGPTSDNQYHVIGQTGEKVAGFELTDLTIDCDLAGQPDTGPGYARIMAGGGGRRAVVERNRVWHCRVGGPYHDAHNTQSLIVRKNYYYNVYTGIYENLGTTSSGKLDGTISQVGSICTFNFSGGLANPFAVGDVVQITKAADGALFGNYEVIGTAANSFMFTEEDEVPSETYKAARAYTVGRLQIEDNVMELALFAPGTQSHAAPSGVALIAPEAFNGLPMIRNALVRGNLIRHFGGVVDPAPPGKSRGVDVSCCRGLIVESNLIGVENADWAVRHYSCGKVKAFNNLTFAGQPLYALKWDVDPNVHTPEIRTQAEDLFLRRR